MYFTLVENQNLLLALVIVNFSFKTLTNAKRKQAVVLKSATTPLVVITVIVQMDSD